MPIDFLKSNGKSLLSEDDLDDIREDLSALTNKLVTFMDQGFPVPGDHDGDGLPDTTMETINHLVTTSTDLLNLTTSKVNGVDDIKIAAQAAAAAAEVTRLATAVLAGEAEGSAQIATTKSELVTSLVSTAEGYKTSASESATSAAASVVTAQEVASTITSQLDIATEAASIALGASAAAGISETNSATSAVTAAGASAAAFQSSIISASVSSGGDLIGNPIFQNWTGTYPVGWDDPTHLVSGSGFFSKAVGVGKYGDNAWRANVTTTSSCYIATQPFTDAFYFSNYYVIDAEVELLSGSITGAGIIIEHKDTGHRVIQSFEGNGVKSGAFYRIRKVIAVPFFNDTTFTNVRFYWAPSLAAVGVQTIKDIRLHKFAVRPASTEEIRTYNIADEITASITTEIGVIIGTDGSVGAKYGVKVDINGYVTGYGLLATENDGVPTSDMVFIVDNFKIVKPSGPGSTATPKVMFAVGEVNGVTQLIVDGELFGDQTINTPAIADQAITADKVTTGTLITGSAQIANAIITNAKISELDAGKLTAGSIIAGSILLGASGNDASTVSTATQHFNDNNDRNNTTVTDPTIPGGGTAVDHIINTDGTASISFEWLYTTSDTPTAANNIDGFLISVNASSSSSAYTPTGIGANETTFAVTRDARSFILNSVACDQWYTFAVQAYRTVDSDVNATGFKKSAWVKSTVAGENPYQPSSTVAYAGNITGTLNGTAVATVVTNAATGASDPATRINAASTKINSGLILVSGTTTLADWRDGTDNTKIGGGNVGANSLTANKMSIGQRGINAESIVFRGNNPTSNKITWTSGVISYTDNTGASATASITAETTGITWSSGTLYLYWVQGATTISNTTVFATANGANNVILAVYKGGTDINTNYGRVIINGSGIEAGSITATQIGVSSLSAISATLGSVDISTAVIGTLSVGTANIANLSITGGKIASNAVSDTVSALTTTNMNLGSSEQTFQTVTITPSSGYVDLKFNFYLTPISISGNGDSGSTTITIRLYRGATKIHEVTSFHYLTSPGIVPIFGNWAHTVMFTDTSPGTSSVSYTARILYSGYDPPNYIIGARYLSATNIRK